MGDWESKFKREMNKKEGVREGGERETERGKRKGGKEKEAIKHDLMADFKERGNLNTTWLRLKPRQRHQGMREIWEERHQGMREMWEEKQRGGR